MMSRQVLISRTTSAVWQAVRKFMLGTDGAALVEFTIFAPIIVVMAIYTTDFGLIFYYKMQVQNAAQAGAQYAIDQGYSKYSPSSIQKAVTNATTYAATSATPAPNLFCGCASSTGVTQISTGSCALAPICGSVAGNYVTVSAKATYNSFLPYGVIAKTYSLTAQSTVRIQ